MTVVFFSVTWYFLLSQSSKTHVCTNIKPRHCSTGSEDPWPRLMVQLETSCDIHAKSSRISEVLTNHLPLLSCKSSELELTNPLSSWGIWPFSAVGAHACPAASAVWGRLRNAAWRLPLGMASPRGRLASRLEALLLPSLHPLLLQLQGAWLELTNDWIVDNVINQKCLH